MKIIDTVSALRQHLDIELNSNIGFVPTMGALHNGHLSLVKTSCERSDITIVSIFVNPTQFNDPEDLKKYPRDISRDTALLNQILGDSDILFIPDYKDLYSREEKIDIDLEGLDTVMEGKHRPGHFKGVIRVVKLLFEVVQPTRAYFGQKDFQQLSIIQKMVENLYMDIEIVSCPILREPNGLAMSSRNERLSPEIRQKASIIYATLKKYSSISSLSEIQNLKKSIINEINSTGDFRIEYFELVDSLSLTSVTEYSKIDPGTKYFGCIALFADEIRLIDNIEFSFQFIKG